LLALDVNQAVQMQEDDISCLFQEKNKRKGPLNYRNHFSSN